MTHEMAGHYAAKHPGASPDPKIAMHLKNRIEAGVVPCAAAHGLAEDLGVSPGEVGRTMDLMELRIEKCQMGLFGYHPDKSIVKAADKVEPVVEKAIMQALVKGRLPCASAWKIAERLGVSKMAVASFCETLKTKICSCQIGAFE